MGLLGSRLYYNDSFTTAFSARVIETAQVEGRTSVVLDATYFYPASGGQPCDTGELGQRRVIDVTVRDRDGAVVHLLDGDLGLGEVAGRIDWSRRVDHMQQHSGQHVLSQAFLQIANAPTVGFHLGVDYASIDVETSGVDEARIREVALLANDVVERDLAVRAWFPTPDELATIALRKAPEVDGALRIVAIGDFDVSACGGTHVARTGQIGLIHLLKTERYKRGLRISFLCGGRARRDYTAKQAIVSSLSAALSCSVPELPPTVERLQHEIQEARRELARHHEAALDHEAAELRGAAVARGGFRLVRIGFERRTVDDLKGLCLRVAAEPGTIVALGTAGDRGQFVLARSEELATDLRPALQAALATVGGGKGGGARIVQGAGGSDVSRALVESALDAAVAPSDLANDRSVRLVSMAHPIVCRLSGGIAPGLASL